MSEDEYLEISDIKRDQSGEYECSALNDVAAPDVRKVKITVNCELICCRELQRERGRDEHNNLDVTVPFSQSPTLKGLPTGRAVLYRIALLSNTCATM